MDYYHSKKIYINTESPSQSLEKKYEEKFATIFSEAFDGRNPSIYIEILQTAAETLADYYTDLQIIEPEKKISPIPTFLTKILTKNDTDLSLVTTILSNACRILAQRKTQQKSQEITEVDTTKSTTQNAAKKALT